VGAMANKHCEWDGRGHRRRSVVLTKKSEVEKRKGYVGGERGPRNKGARKGQRTSDEERQSGNKDLSHQVRSSSLPPFLLKEERARRKETATRSEKASSSKVFGLELTVDANTMRVERMDIHGRRAMPWGKANGPPRTKRKATMKTREWPRLTNGKGSEILTHGGR